MLDAETYPRTEIIALYLKRWNVELDFDAIKTTMKMDMLRCKSPEMVRKEICINLLVFNLIKSLMGRAAQYIGKKPREISFKAAQETLVSFHQTLLMAPVDSLEIRGYSTQDHKPGGSINTRSRALSQCHWDFMLSFSFGQCLVLQGSQ